MRVLISAYACNPYKGSEPGVGWNWVSELNKLGHEVYVLTRLKNKNDIEKYITINPNCRDITFIYHDMPLSILKFKSTLGVYVYYELWQITALKKVKNSHRIYNFDCIHHLTFGSFRQPSYLHKIGLPFYFGPVGGGEIAPKKLLKGLPFRDQVKEFIRFLANTICLKRRSLNKCFEASRIIFCKTEETLNLIPSKYKSKSIIQNEIGQDIEKGLSFHRILPDAKKVLNVLYVGRLVSWKGPHLAILAFIELKKRYPNATLSIIGDGVFYPFLKKMVENNNLSESITFKGNIAHHLVNDYYNKSDIFIFPSLHDSSGNVVLEALNSGLPTICLNTGGPLFILTKDCPSIVDCDNMSQEAVVEGLTKMLLKIAENATFYEECSRWSLKKINELTWTKVVGKAYELIELDLKSKLRSTEDLRPNNIQKFNRIIIAYACEDSGSEPGVGYYWTKAIATICKDEKILLITRKNNNVSTIVNNVNLFSLGIDLPSRILTTKKFLGIRMYYFIWQFLVFIHLLFNIRKYKDCIIHQLTFTPLYYPPIVFLLPFKFIWGPLGGGEYFPLSYLSALKKRDAVKEIFRIIIRNSVYINPLFYLGCAKSIKIICSSPDSARMIPSFYKHKVALELMVFDKDKNFVNSTPEKNIIIANRLIDWKMTHLFVQAFSEYIAKNDTEYKLIIVGDGPYYNRIEPFIDNVNIIHFKRFKQREEMLNVLKNASLFVSTSLHDSGSASLLEAISYGLPFLATRTGAHNVYLDKGIGFGFELENFNLDKEKIKSILFKILNDKSILIEESKRIVECYRDYFSESAKIIRIKKLIDKKQILNLKNSKF